MHKYLCYTPESILFVSSYQAAQKLGTGFRLFVSFDMTELRCGSADDADVLRKYITTYSSHPNQLIYNGRVFASAFSGEFCKFGQNSVKLGWSTQFLQQLTGQNAVYFVPSFFVDQSDFRRFDSVIDGMFNNSGWPIQVTAKSIIAFTSRVTEDTSLVGITANDGDFIRALQPINGSYIASVSPWFFTHYSPESLDKNWIYLSDDHLYVDRWEYLVRIREKIDIVQVISWNDFGESHYIGPIKGVQPNSQAWVDGFDHTAWLNMTSFYATAFKTGTYPTVTKDQIVMWSRSHPALAKVSHDPVGQPENFDISADKVWVIVFATSPAMVTVSTSSTQSKTFNVTTGVSKLSLPIDVGGHMKAALVRDSNTVVDLEAEGFSFNPTPSSYNYNAFVVSSS